MVKRSILTYLAAGAVMGVLGVLSSGCNKSADNTMEAAPPAPANAVPAPERQTPKNMPTRGKLGGAASQ